MRRLVLAAVTALAAGALLAGCAAPADLDGEAWAAAGAGLPPAPARMPGATVTPVVVDTDLGADDLVALAFLLRHPEVEVHALTIAATGLVGCETGVDVVAGLVAALEEQPVPVACGPETAGAGGRPFPTEWATAAELGSGVAPAPGTAVAESAPQLIARQARDVAGLVLVALGPMTNVADLASQHPEDYARLAGIHAMAGSVAGPVVDGVAEWNVAADPRSLETVLASPVPVTLVPEDAVPTGTPELLAAAPVVGRVVTTADIPAWWDLAAVAALVAPDLGSPEQGAWVLDPSVPGRLVRSPGGAGAVQVHTSLDAAALEPQYARVLGGATGGS